MVATLVDVLCSRVNRTGLGRRHPCPSIFINKSCSAALDSCFTVADSTDIISFVHFVFFLPNQNFFWVCVCVSNHIDHTASALVDEQVFGSLLSSVRGLAFIVLDITFLLLFFKFISNI